jgi:hypothetical protein
MPTTNTPGVQMGTRSFNPDNWQQQGGRRETFGADIASSVNMDLLNGYYNGGLRGLMAKRNVGFLKAPKLDTSDFGRFLQFIPDLAVQNNLIQRAIDDAGRDVMSLMSINNQNIGPSLTYIDEDNKDGMRMFSHVVYESDERQVSFRFRVDLESVVKTNELNGTPGNAPIGTDVERIYLSPNNSFLGDLRAGCLSCVPNTAGRGYRQLFIFKNTNSLYGGTFPTGGQATSVANEVVIVLDVQDPGDGGLILYLKRAANGKTVDVGGIQFQSGGVTIGEGDYILVGNITPTQECYPEHLQCQYIQPKEYTYCSTIKPFVGCIAQVSQTRFLTQSSQEIMTRKEQLALEILNNYKTFMNRTYNEFVYGDEINSQYYLAPEYTGSPTSTFGKGTNTGELIPAGIKGIFRQFDALATPLNITFNSCDQTCWEYTLDTLIKAIEAGYEGDNYSNSYTDPGWLLVGDIEGLDELYNSRETNFLNLSQADNQASLRANARTYSNTPVSLFSSANSQTAVDLNNEYNKMGSNYGIKTSVLQLGPYKFRSLHDRLGALLEPGVIRLIYMPDIKFFTDNLDANMNSIFGGNNPFLPASSVQGRLQPVIYTNDLQNVQVNGVNKFMAKNNCPLSWQAEMRAGVHMGPVNIGRSLRITLNMKKPNPNFGAEGEEAFIYGQIWDLDCACMKARKNVEVQLDTWANGEIVNGPIF